jgi:hypothetical protein
MSKNAWLYTFANPINLTDPTGKFPEWYRLKWTKWGYAKCVLDYYHLKSAGSIFFNGDAVKNVKGSPRCWGGPIEYRAMGYLEGYSWFGTLVWGGEEIVYDFATMERSAFSYIGGGINDSALGGGYALYVGLVEGLRSDKRLQDSYIGYGFVRSVGADISLPIDTVSLGFGGVATTSLSDNNLKTLSAYIGISASIGVPYIDVGAGIVNYEESGINRNYSENHDMVTMLIDITYGRYTPYPESVQDIAELQLLQMRFYAAMDLMPYYGYVYEEMRDERIRSDR